MPKRTAILAAAGAGKTTEIAKLALAASGGTVLLLTFTNENQRRLVAKIRELAGYVPDHVRVMGWFAFLIGECVKPYQRAVTGVPFAVRGLNFSGEAPLYESNDSVARYLDGNLDLYRDRVAQCAELVNNRTNGLVAQRLERCFSHILVDEVQDCVGYDLEVLDILLGCDIDVTMVGDPRQAILATNLNSKNKQYRGQGLWRWIKERSKVIALVERNASHRCHSDICGFANSIFPALPPSYSALAATSGHDGIFFVSERDVEWYVSTYRPDAVLRYSKVTPTLGLPAINIGVAKGATYDRVLIFPTKPMRRFLATRDSTPLKTAEDLYVAVTRARFSAAFVVPEDDCSTYTQSSPGVHALPTGAV